RSLSRFVNLDGDLHLGSEFIDRLSTALAETAKGISQTIPARTADRPENAASDVRVPQRNRAIKGPLDPAGEWGVEHAGAAAKEIAVARLADSGDITYEIVNFVDGRRTVTEIRDVVSAEFEPIPLSAVAEYLDVLARAGAISYK